MTIATLFDILPPPASPVAGNVAAAESALGVSLPPDYADLVRHYGAGRIADFLWIFQPEAPRETIDLATQAREQTDVLRELADAGEDVPYPLHPDAGGLLPLGMTDNGDVLYWLTTGEPAEWTIVVHEARGPEWFAYDGDITGFLAAVLSGDTRCPIFPRDFPPEAPAFEPVDS